MAIEAYKKEQERIVMEARVAAGLEAEEKEPLTLAGIMKDKKSSDLFAKMIEKTNPSDGVLLERFTVGKLDESQDDTDSMETYREEFEKRMEKVESLKEYLTAENIKELSKIHPDFKKITNKVGVEDTCSVLENVMAELAVTDEDSFNKIFKKLESVKTFEDKTGGALDERIKKFCDDNKINEEEYIKILSETDLVKQRKGLSDLVEDSWGQGLWAKFKRTTKTMAFGRIFKDNAKVQSFLSEKAEIDNYLKELSKHKGKIAAALSETIKDNEMMGNAFTKTISGEKFKPETESFGEVKANILKFTPGKIEDTWEKAKKGFVDMPNATTGGTFSTRYNSLNPAEKQVALDLFKKNTEANIQNVKGKGLWSAVFSVFTSAYFTDASKGLKI